MTYYIRCPNCGKIYRDDGIIHTCHICTNPLLDAVYTTPPFKRKIKNIFDYGWIPVRQKIKTDIKPVVYKSESLGDYFGIKHLYIAFSGYWPEKGAFMRTCTFKDLETHVAISRIGQINDTIVVPSTGNVARSFAYICCKTNNKCLIITLKDSMHKMWLPIDNLDSLDNFNDNIKLILLGKDFNYTDAITLCEKLCTHRNFFYDGGWKNVARRDGAGLVYLEFLRKFRCLPDFYVQAVGSGVGALGVYGHQKRLKQKNDFPTRIIAVQSSPLHPIYDFIKGIAKPYEVLEREERYTKIKELTNLKPPLHYVNGIGEAIRNTNGDVYYTTYSQAKRGVKIFKKCEGIDILLPAGVAVYSLHKLVEDYKIDNEKVLIHITGGGLKRLKKDYKIVRIKPTYYTKSHEEVEEFIKNIVSEEKGVK